MQAGGIEAEVCGVQHIFDDLAKGQRHNSQIIPLKTQHRDAYQKTRNSCGNAANKQRQRKADRHCQRIFRAHGKTHGRKGAHAHKAGMAKA